MKKLKEMYPGFIKDPKLFMKVCGKVWLISMIVNICAVPFSPLLQTNLLAYVVSVNLVVAFVGGSIAYQLFKWR